MKKKRTDRLCKKTDDRSEKNLKEKKKKIFSHHTQKQHKEKIIILKVLHILRYLLPSSHQHATKTKPTFEKKKRRAGGGVLAE